MKIETVYIVISVLNEQDNIEILAKNSQEMIEHFPSYLKPKYIFVNDGSTDKTVEYIKQYFTFVDTEIINHEKNLGPGAAFSNAFQSLSNVIRENDWVLTMEGDNTSSHQLVKRMFRRSEEGYDVILASPYIYGGTMVNTSRFRKLLSFGSNLVLRELLGLRGFFTMSSFFRLYRGSVIRRLLRIYSPRLIESTGFEGVVELLMKMVFLEIKISEVPLILDTANRKGKSKMKVFKNAFGLIMLFRHRHRWKLMTEQSNSFRKCDDALPRTL